MNITSVKRTGLGVDLAYTHKYIVLALLVSCGSPVLSWMARRVAKGKVKFQQPQHQLQ